MKIKEEEERDEEPQPTRAFQNFNFIHVKTIENHYSTSVMNPFKILETKYLN